eukprot:TRINITY_DN3573_c0_g1_i1.p1 TRINITY_DN3573_c0_g1~~TRINITY_DN3573_c0_g1_i1.p1  ORF type:complete len:498 (+),score=124.56 TRINITY_DN3573_c0_g1_i1:35-1495(+)
MKSTTLLLAVLCALLAVTAAQASERVCEADNLDFEEIFGGTPLAGYFQNKVELCFGSLLFIEACDVEGFLPYIDIATTDSCGSELRRGELMNEDICPLFTEFVEDGSRGDYTLEILESTDPSNQEMVVGAFVEGIEVGDEVVGAKATANVESFAEGMVRFEFDDPGYPLMMTRELMDESTKAFDEEDWPDNPVFIALLTPTPPEDKRGLNDDSVIMGLAMYAEGQWETRNRAAFVGGRDVSERSGLGPELLRAQEQALIGEAEEEGLSVLEVIMHRYFDQMDARHQESNKRGFEMNIDHSFAFGASCEFLEFVEQGVIGDGIDSLRSVRETYSRSFSQWKEKRDAKRDVNGDLPLAISLGGNFAHGYELRQEVAEVFVLRVEFDIENQFLLGNGLQTVAQSWKVLIELSGERDLVLGDLDMSDIVRLSNLRSVSSERRELGSSFVADVTASCDGLAEVCLDGVCARINVIQCLARQFDTCRGSLIR